MPVRVSNVVLLSWVWGAWGAWGAWWVVAADGHLGDSGEAVARRAARGERGEMIPKIIGGKPTDIERYPFKAQFFNNGALCAASILGSKVFLTAGHCFDFNQDMDEMHIHVGAKYIGDAKETQTHGVWDYVVHEEYNSSVQFQCDIALMFIEGSLIFGPKVQKALLVDTDSWMNEAETYFEALGWGWTTYGGTVSKKGLLQTHLRYVSLEKCKRLHHQYLSNDMFCLYGDGERDSCRGDSGGGILWNGLLVGVVSHGDGCGLKDKPSVYSNVFVFRGWILSKWLEFRKKYCGNTRRAVDEDAFELPQTLYV